MLIINRVIYLLSEFHCEDSSGVQLRSGQEEEEQGGRRGPIHHQRANVHRVKDSIKRMKEEAFSSARTHTHSDVLRHHERE